MIASDGRFAPAKQRCQRPRGMPEPRQPRPCAWPWCQSWGMGGAATPREAATPYRTVTHGQARVRERQAKPHDRDNVRSSNDGRNETRSLRLTSTLRVNSGTHTHKQKDRPKAVSVLSASLLVERNIFPQFESAQTKLLSRFVSGFRRRRRAIERERGIRKLLPDGKIFGRNCEPAKFEHVSARFGHSSGLLPSDFTDAHSF